MCVVFCLVLPVFLFLVLLVVSSRFLCLVRRLDPLGNTCVFFLVCLELGYVGFLEDFMFGHADPEVLLPLTVKRKKLQLGGPKRAKAVALGTPDIGLVSFVAVLCT